MAIFPTTGRPSLMIGRVFVGRPRLLLSIAAALVVYLVEPSSIHTATRCLIAWNVGTWLYIVLYLWMMATSDDKTIRWRANITDDGQFVILALAAVAAIASMVAIVAQLSITKDMKGLDKGLHLGLAALTIVSAWLFIHLTFAIHYAHQYFDETKTKDGEKPTVHGGLNFPDTDEPDYWDFLYFSFIIGVASQTADISIASKVMRRTSLAHSVLSFFFNSAILALTINIAAGLI
jgi:uncharacterized membrane protein